MMLDPSLFLRRFLSLISYPSFPYLALISSFHCAFKLIGVHYRRQNNDPRMFYCVKVQRES